jgi:hypothetical protein
MVIWATNIKMRPNDMWSQGGDLINPKSVGASSMKLTSLINIHIASKWRDYVINY